MIAAAQFSGLTAFYQNLLEVRALPQKGFVMLDDSDTGQMLCVTDGPSLNKSGVGLEVDDLSLAMQRLTQLGGTIESTFEYPSMRGAKARDPESNEILMFQIIQS
jgi:hypothetical protein